MTISLATLFSTHTALQLYATALEVASAMGLPVSSWRVDDPTRAQFKYQATVLAEMDQVVSQFIKSGFLSYAEDDWLTLKAYEDFNVTRTEATYSTPSITLHNAGGGFYPREAGDLIFKSSVSGKTFHSTSAGTLSAGATVTFTLISDEPGSDNSVAVNEIDEMVTTLLGVEIVSSTSAVAVDLQSPESLIAQCKATLAAVSPSGPGDAYEYVAKNVELTGTSLVTRAVAVTTGDHEVTVYLAGPDGAVTGTEIAAVQSAIDTWARPLTITAIAASAAELAVDLEIEISGEDLPTDIEGRISNRLEALFAVLEIGDTLSLSRIIHEVHEVHEGITSVVILDPAVAPAPDPDEVLVLASRTVTEV